MQRIALITPNWNWDQSPLPTDTLLPPISTPIEWAYLSRGLGPRPVLVVDAYARGLTKEETVRQVLDFDASIAIISTCANLLYWRCPPLSIDATSSLVLELEDMGFNGSSILIGPHATHSPDWCLMKTGATAAWRGSSDVALGPAIVSGTWRDSRHIHAAVGESSTVRVDSAAELPVADFHAYDPQAYYPPHAWTLSDLQRETMGVRGPGLLMEASRGCPWSCAYCAKGPVRDAYTRRSLPALENELLQAKNAGYEYVFFIDETFNITSPHFYELLNLLRRSGLKFGFQGRPDLISAEIASDLAAAGCVYVELGIDVAEEELSRQVGRRQSLGSAEAGLEACRSNIPIVRFNRLNFTTLDYKALYPSLSTQDWNVPVDPVYPYPGSPLGEALMRMYGFDSYDWEFAQQYVWWLRIEVSIQRQSVTVDENVVEQLKNFFLTLSRDAARSVAEIVKPFMDGSHIQELNKSIGGVGGGLHIDNTGT